MKVLMSLENGQPSNCFKKYFFFLRKYVASKPRDVKLSQANIATDYLDTNHL